MSFKLVNNETIVYAQDYYKKLLEKFTRLAGNNIYADTYLRLMDELMDFRNVGLKDKNDVYASPEAKKQLYYILDLLLAALPIKVDTVKSSANKAPLEVEVILDYFKANITGDKTKNNKFIYDDYIGNDMNRLKLMREIEIIRNYYNMSK